MTRRGRRWQLRDGADPAGRVVANRQAGQDKAARLTLVGCAELPWRAVTLAAGCAPVLQQCTDAGAAVGMEAARAASAGRERNPLPMVDVVRPLAMSGNSRMALVQAADKLLKVYDLAMDEDSDDDGSDDDEEEEEDDD